MRASPTPMAIVGMACIFPAAPDVETYWNNIVDGVSAIGEPPADWHADRYLDPESGANDRVYTCRGGWLGELATFDPLTHGVMPSSVDGGEPDQYLALQVAHDALQDAVGAVADPGRTGVIIGHGTYINRGFSNVIQHGVVVDQTIRLLHRLHPEHTDAELELIKQQLKSTLPPFEAGMAPGLVPNVMSGRIANRLDLMGPNFTVDAACASSLVALELAINELDAGRSDAMLVGGVHTSTPAPILQIFCQLEAVSRSGELRAFAADADGTLLGEGLGFLVLKRLPDAIDDGDRIYALVRSVGVASDGRAAGLLAPRLDGERLALRRAYQTAGVDPATVGLIEAHGTGTPAGDEAELRALTEVLGGPAANGPSVALGTVKSMISHLLPAAGMAGLIKTALALHHKVLPPTLHHGAGHPALDGSRLYLNTRTRPWVQPAGRPRRAGVDAFGFGGINAHAVLEEYAAARPVRVGTDRPVIAPRRHWPAEVVLLCAADRGRLVERCRSLADRLAAGDAELTSVAAEAALGQDVDHDGKERLAVVATSVPELITHLREAADRLADPGCRQLRDRRGLYYTDTPLGPGTTAFLFPGEGSPYPGMLTDTAVAFGEVRSWFDLMDGAFADHPRNLRPSDAVFPPPTPDGRPGEGGDGLLNRMDVGPEALFAASQGLLELLDRLGIRPDAAVGHSSGEWSALVAAGALPIDDRSRVASDVAALNRVYERARQDGVITPAALLAVGAVRRADVDRELAGGRVQLAMDNCPHQVVLAGDSDAITAAEARLTAAGAVCERLPFDRGYHTAAFAAFADRVRSHLESLPFGSPRIPLWSASTAALFGSEPAAVRDLAAAQWASPVRFTATVEAMYAAGSRVFVEVGPAARLTGFVRDILHGRPHLAVAADGPPGGLQALVHLVGQLYVHRVGFRPAELFAGRVPPPVTSRPAPRLQTALATLELPDDFELPASAGPTIPTALPERNGQPAAASVPDDRAAAVSAHLQTMGEFLRLQADVLAAYLGQPVDRPEPTATAVAPPVASTPAPIPEPIPEPVPQPIPEPIGQQTPPAAQPTSPAAGPEEGSDVAALIRDLLSERTGYPTELLTDDLDLESDLGIDSIKRVEMLGALQQRRGPFGAATLTSLRPLRTIRELVSAITVDRGNDDHARLQPWIDEIVVHEPGRRLVARHRFDLDRHPFLADHTIERRTPSRRHPERVGLPIVPLTATLELAAQAALALAGRGLVVAISDVAARHWISLDAGHRTVRVTAERSPEPDAPITVEVTENLTENLTEDLPEDTDGADEASQRPRTLLTASVTVAADYPEPPPLSLPADDPAIRAAAGPLYGPGGLFHGPAFHVLVDPLISANGARCTLACRGTRALEPEQPLITDPAVLDGPGQLLALWLRERRTDRPDIFPVRIGALELYAPPSADPSEQQCSITVRDCTDDGLLSDLEVSDSGRLTARFIGWQDVRLGLDADVRSFLDRPDQSFLSRPWSPPVGLAPDSPTGRTAPAGRRLRLPAELAGAAGGLWLRVLAHAVLDPAERPDWRDLDRAAPARRLEWLAGRIAAKEAVRSLLGEGAELADADIRIGRTGSGAPVVAAPAEAAGLHVSIAHSAGLAVAVAADPRWHRAVGIDLQAVDGGEPMLGPIAFGSDEQQFLDAVADADRPLWATRLWCAKEAAAKADGTGLPPAPADLRVTVPAPAVEGRQPGDPVLLIVAGGRRVWTAYRDGFVSAVCLDDPAPVLVAEGAPT